MPLSEVLWEENWVHNRNYMHLYMWTKQNSIGKRCYVCTGIASAWNISGYVYHFVSLPVWTITDHCLKVQFKTAHQPDSSSGNLCGGIWLVHPWLPFFFQMSWCSAVWLLVTFGFRELVALGTGLCHRWCWQRNLVYCIVWFRLSQTGIRMWQTSSCDLNNLWSHT